MTRHYHQRYWGRELRISVWILISCSYSSKRLTDLFYMAIHFSNEHFISYNAIRCFTYMMKFGGHFYFVSLIAQAFRGANSERISNFVSDIFKEIENIK
jgi:hypothetical protein